MKRSREPDEEEPSSPSTGSEDLDSAASRSKIAEIDPSEEAPSMACLLHREKMTFRSYGEYESHYNNEHVNRCFDCKKNFPSSHLLGIHIEDCHDPLVSVKREKGEHTVSRPLPILPATSKEPGLTLLQYSCFVEDCERKCGTPDKRRRHLIDKHMYPRNFFFAITRDGVDGRRSLLEDGGRRHRRRSSTQTKRDTRTKSTREPAEEANTAGDSKSRPARDKQGKVEEDDDGDAHPDVEMDDLVGAMSALKFVPSSIRFGRGGKVGFSRR